MAVILAIGWASLVLAQMWSRRPAPCRARALAHDVAESPRPLQAGISGVMRSMDVLGSRWLRLLRLDPLAVGSRYRISIGFGALITAIAIPVFPPVGVVLAVVAVLVPLRRERSKKRADAALYLRHLPEVVDLLCLTTGAGLNVSLAIEAVARSAPSPFSEELIRVTREVALGRRLADALEDVVDRTDELIRPLIASLVASERYGAPLAKSLERLSDEIRSQRRRRAEEAARRVPVKLLFPLVLCILPAFGLLTMAPLLAGGLKALRL